MEHFIKGKCELVEIPPTDIEKLNSKINYTNSRINSTNKNVTNVSNRVANITPYEESKTAYIGDTEVTFYKGKDGIINTTCITENGLSIPTTFEVLENNVVVRFEELEEVATVTISIQ